MSRAGIGPLALGRSWADLVADPDVRLTGSLEQCATSMLAAAGERFAVSFPAGDAGDDAPLPTVQSVTALRAGGDAPAILVAGAAGVGFGSSPAAVEAAYPGGSWAEPTSRALDQLYVTSAGPVTFGFKGGVVTAVAVGARDIPDAFCP